MIMPRAKKPKPQPNETFVIQVDDQEVICEVWENSADEGTRGSHMRRKFDAAFDAALAYCETGLAGNSNITKQKVNRLIHGDESLAAFGRVITTIAKNKNIKIGQTLSEDVAKRVRNHYRAIQNALAEKNR